MLFKQYISKFETEEEYLSFLNSVNFIRPNVSLVAQAEERLRFTPKGDKIQLLDILWEKDGGILVTSDVIDPERGYTPIGLCVVPEDFFGYGENARFMSLKYMTYSIDPETNNLVGGSSLTNQGMTWDETTVYTPKTNVYTQEQLNTSAWKADWTNINYSWPDLSIIANKTRASASFDWGYLPSDNFNKLYDTSGLNSYYWEDSTRGWHNDALTNNRPLANLYQSDGTWLGRTTEIGTNYALYQINGKENSYNIVNSYKNALPNSEDKGVIYLNRPTFQSRLAELKPFFVCSEYSTNSTNKGDWYLPACGELAMIIPNLKKINQKLALIKAQYASDCISGLASAIYWSSTEHIWSYAWYVYTGNGYVYTNNKYSRHSVVAFLQF